jgi:uncharacterized membrane protein (UPF0182 family)
MMASVLYVFALPVVQSLTNCISKRGVIFLGFVFQTVAVYVMGMTSISTWHNPGFFMMAGLSIFGFSFAMITIPVLPEILEGVENKYSEYKIDEVHL